MENLLETEIECLLLIRNRFYIPRIYACKVFGFSARHYRITKENCPNSTHPRTLYCNKKALFDFEDWLIWIKSQGFETLIKNRLLYVRRKVIENHESTNSD